MMVINNLKASFIICIAVLVPCLISSISAADCNPECKVFKPYGCSDPRDFNAAAFPDGFYFGGASSAYQVEGAARRGSNIWDSFTHRYSDDPKMSKDNGDVGTGSYHLYKEDVQTLVEMGANAYRFSIAWSRLMPKGKPSKDLFDNGLNLKGVAYYKDLIDELTSNGIEPFVTLFHWDLPQYLDDHYGGFLSPEIVDDYGRFAELCFGFFGEKVKRWITLNQPYSYAFKGYGDGTYPPLRCSRWMEEKECVGGNSGTEPYLAAHYQILAHARAVDIYRTRFSGQDGKIGTTLITRWFEPYDDTPQSKLATERAFDFFLGWFLEPMTRGDYPDIMKQYVGDRLPQFNDTERDLLKDSLDFLGVNYYIAQYVKEAPPPDLTKPSVETDARTIYSYFNKDDKPIGEEGFGLYFYPPGLMNILNYIKVNYFDKYDRNIPVYITENGYRSNGTLPLGQILRDKDRIDYHCSHLSCLKCAIENVQDLQVEGYFAWSNLDNYEFLDGFSSRFGMNYVDFGNVTDRQAKDSAIWYKNFNAPRRSPKLLRTSV